MKKQRLFGTIASLTLAIALLAFGVYAAGAVTFNVTNTVTYTFSDVLVDINATLYRVATGTSTIVGSDDVAGLGDDDWTLVEGGVTNGTLKSYTGTDGVYTQDSAASTVNSSIAFNMNNAFAYKVEIDFSTVSTSGVTVTYNDTAFVDSVDNDNITLIVNADAENASIVTGDTYTFVYYVLLEDATTEVDLTLPALNFTINKTV